MCLALFTRCISSVTRYVTPAYNLFALRCPWGRSLSEEKVVNDNDSVDYDEGYFYQIGPSSRGVTSEQCPHSRDQVD